MKKIMTWILSAVLAINSIPHYLMSVTGEEISAQAIEDSEYYVSDPNTLNSWETMFTDASTEYAGAIWTDKTVLKHGDTSFHGLAVVSSSEVNGNLVMQTSGTTNVSADEGNFLVAMSALGATKQVTGYSNLPSDTVLILDVSNSMSSAELRAMVEAANKAIAELLGLNLHNRVGVVIYGTDAEMLLAIDRYTTTSTAGSGNNRYAEYIRISGSQIISVGRSATGGGFDVSSIDFAEIVKNIPNNSIANYLGRVLPASKTNQVAINWTNKLRGQNHNSWTAEQWENFLRETVITEVASAQTSSVGIGGATYIQGGMNVAKQMFNEIDDTSIETGLIQGGTKRIPIVVLMSDGAPTYGTTSYTNATNSNRNMGNGSSSSVCDQLVFVSQLTAADLRQEIEDHYGRDSLFYTLGLGLEYQEANRVLNPANYTSNNLNNWWTSYQRTGNSTIYQYDGRNVKRLEQTASDIDAIVNNRYYVDEYFPADNDVELIAAFDSIVETIILQSRYYPTLVEGTQVDLDGYITFEDEIGEFMEVKEIEGMEIGGTIYTGQAFLNALNTTSLFGNAQTWSAYGEELLNSIAERLNIANNEARTLLSSAWRTTSNQLHKNNYIGWYADAQGNYLGHWNDEGHTEENYPSNAAYLNKSYIFSGELGSAHPHLSGSDMMHIVVQVHEEIETGHQCVIWKIPASLVPLVTYSVTVNTNSLDTATQIDLSMTPERPAPIRLLFEVGLIDGINEINLLDKMAHTRHSHPVVEDGKTIGYAFYSNRWGEGHTPDGSGETDVLDPQGHLATVSHFTPSKENERYYYTEDTVITDASGQPYRGTNKPSGDNYYHAYRIIKKNSSNQFVIEYKYVPIASSVLSAEGDMAIRKTDDGTWVVPAGQIYQQIARHQVTKSANSTDTLVYYDYPVIVHSSNSEDYSIYDFLGNNGRLILLANQGIKISKLIDNPNDPYDGSFTFVVKLTPPEGQTLAESYETLLVKADGTEESNTAVVNQTEGTVTLSVKNRETIYLAGLPAGTSYTIEENNPLTVLYRVKSVTAEEVIDEVIAAGTVDENQFDSAAFVNTVSSRKGNLEITKTVVHPYGESYQLANNLRFIVEVTLAGIEDGTKFTTTGTTKNGTPVTEVSVSNGKITLEMGHEDSIIIQGIPEDTQYIVEENLTNAPNWTKSGEVLNDEENPEKNQYIQSDRTEEAHLVNTLSTIVPVDVADIDIEISKTLTGRDNDEWLDNDSFEFIVERWNGQEWENISVSNQDKAVITKTTEDHTVTISGTMTDGENEVPRISFDTLGRYFYRVSEVVGNAEGITYDATHRYFYIDVTDVNTDGVLELSVRNYNGTEVTTSEDKRTVVAVEFNNHYASGVAEINIAKLFNNTTGIEVGMDSFEFVLADHEPNAECSTSDGHTHTVVKPNAGGSVMIPLVYTKTDLNSQSKAEFTYYVWEQKGNIANLNYDGSIYQVKVTVTENEDYSIDTEVDFMKNGEEATAILFTNSYELEAAAALQVLIDKEIEGITENVNEVFEFEVFKTSSNFQVGSEMEPAATVEITNDGSEPVDLGGFTQAGTYYFVVREKAGDNLAITYDASVYHITVSVGAHESEAKLVVTNLVIHQVGGGTVSNPETPTVLFTNQYRILQGTSVTLRGDKDLVGKTITAKDDFSFKIEAVEAGAPLPSNTIAKAAAPSGNFTFETIYYNQPGVYNYLISEVIDFEKAEDGNVIKTESGSVVTYDLTVHEVKVEVTDNGEGVLSATVTGANALNFENKYEYGSVSVQFDALKSYVNNSPYTDLPFKNGDFEFELYKTNNQYVAEDEPIATIGNGYIYDDKTGEAKVLNARPELLSVVLNYNEPGTYYYILQEKTGADHTIRYDEKVYRIMIVVSDYGEGDLVPTITVTQGGQTIRPTVDQGDSGSTGITFRNVHVVNYTDEDIPIKKHLINETGIIVPMNLFTFGLYEKNSEGELVEVTKENQPIISAASSSGDASIHLQFNDATMGPSDSVTYEYYVKEIIPEEINQMEGITYDKSMYKVVIEVGYDSNKNLSATETFTLVVDAQGNELAQPQAVEVLEFTNKYEPVELLDKDVHLASETFSVDGRTVSYGDELTYRIVYTNPSFNEVVDEAVLVDEIPEGTVYISSEGGTYADGKITWTFSEVEPGESKAVSFTVKVVGKAGAEIKNQAEISIGENTYYSNETYNNVVIEKDVVQSNGESWISVDGEAVLAGDVLTYQIKYVNPSDTLTVKEVTIQDVVPNGTEYVDGSASNAGTYADSTVTWVLKDIEPNGTRTVSFQVKVVQYDAALITNKAKVSISGNDYTTNEVFNYVVEKEVSKSHANVGDEVTYTINYINFEETAATVKITDTLAEGLTMVKVNDNGQYDASSHSIAWTISNVPAKTSGTVSFTAKINEKAVTIVENKAQIQVGNHSVVETNPVNVSLLKSTQFNAVKKLDGRELSEGEFEFELYQTNSTFALTSSPIQVKKNAEDGSVVFEEIEFEGLGSYYFVVKERSGALGGIAYDASEYRITVTLTEGSNGVELHRTITKNGTSVTEIEFVNTYDVKPDATTSAVIQGQKHLTGREWNASDTFKFQLYPANANYEATGDVIETVSVDKDDHSFEFTAIEYTKAEYKESKSYYFIVKEVKESIGGIVYDETVQKIQINLSDDGQGNLVHEIRVNESDSNEVLFTNEYKVTPQPFELLGKKELDGRSLLENEFAFTLYESDSSFTHREKKATVSNQSDGTFKFTVEGKAPGTYYFVITEEQGTLGGITYDPTHYHVTVTVTDDGLGKTTAQAVYEHYSGSVQLLSEITMAGFKNYYEAKDETPLTITGTKVLENRTAVNGEFTFELYETGSDYQIAEGAKPVKTTVNQNGKFNFEGLTYNEAGTHYYVVKEVKGSAGGITYSEESIRVTVKVEDNLQGELVAKTVNSEGGEISDIGTITNSYQAAASSVILAGTKALHGRNWLDTDSFTFELYQTGNDYLIAPESTAIESVTVTKDNPVFSSDTLSFKEFSFKALSFNEAGVHYYAIKEVPESIGGITYDGTVFGVRITVVDHFDGTVTPTVEYFADGNPVVKVQFDNIYELSDDAQTSIVLSGTKALEGRALEDREFTFELYETGSDYQIAEGTEPKLARNVSNTFVFETIIITNEEYEKKVNNQVDAYKEQVIAEAMAKAKEEATRLEEERLAAEEAAKQEAERLAAEQAAAANEPAPANEPGADPGLEAAPANEPGADPGLEAVPANEPGADPGLEAVPANEPGADPGLEAVPANEPGADPALEAAPVNEPVTDPYASVPKKEDIQVPEELKLNEVKYYYVVKEKDNSLGGVDYDERAYHVIVTVYDDQNGNLAHTVEIKLGDESAQIHFENKYSVNPTDIVLSGTKSLDGRNLNDGEFTFALYESNDTFTARSETPLKTVRNAGSEFTFTVPNKAPGTYYFIVEEKPGELGGVTYDKSHYHVTVTVKDDLKGQSVVDSTKIDQFTFTDSGIVHTGNVEKIVFNNSYKAVDNNGLIISGTKRLNGREQINGEFTFELYEADAEYKANDAPVSTANNIDGIFTFDELKFTGTGKYHYVVKEKNLGKGGMTYDSYEFNVLVTVTDPGNGELDASYEVVNLANSNDMVFNNTYQIIKSENIVITGLKEISGRDWLDTDSFTFELYATGDDYLIAPNTDAIDSVAATKDNPAFTFDAIEVKEEKVHYFVVKEVAESIGGITYDTSEYHVEVNVIDNHDGTLSVVQKMMLVDEIADTAKFTNTYKANSTKEGEGLPLSADKTLNGRTLQSGEFRFELYQTKGDFLITDNPIQIVTNDAQGQVQFAKLDYNALGTYYYVVMEQSGSLGGIKYDPVKYYVTIEVTDKWDGYYTADVKSIVRSDNGSTVTAMAFENDYVPSPTDQGIVFEAVKVLNGKTLAADQFTFALYKASESYSYGGVAEQIVKNSADGKVIFSEINYDKAGDYYYIIKEINDKQTHVTYDESEYQIKVQVVDDYSGHLNAQVVSVKKAGIDAFKMEFKNSYIKPDDPTPVIVPPNTSDPTSIGSWSALGAVSLLLAALLMLLKKKKEQES